MLYCLVPDDVPKISVKGAYEKEKQVLFFGQPIQRKTRGEPRQNCPLFGSPCVLHGGGKDVPKRTKPCYVGQIGKRSGEIGTKLIEAGFTNVQNLYGGIFEWVNRGHKVVDGNGRPTTNVHGYSKLWSKWLNQDKKTQGSA